MKVIEVEQFTTIDYSSIENGVYEFKYIGTYNIEIVFVVNGFAYVLYNSFSNTVAKEYDALKDLIDSLEKVVEVEKIVEVEKPVYMGGVTESTLLKAIALAQTPSAIKEIDV